MNEYLDHFSFIRIAFRITGKSLINFPRRNANAGAPIQPEIATSGHRAAEVETDVGELQQKINIRCREYPPPPRSPPPPSYRSPICLCNSKIRARASKHTIKAVGLGTT